MHKEIGVTALIDPFFKHRMTTRFAWGASGVGALVVSKVGSRKLTGPKQKVPAPVSSIPFHWHETPCGTTKRATKAVDCRWEPLANQGMWRGLIADHRPPDHTFGQVRAQAFRRNLPWTKRMA